MPVANEQRSSSAQHNRRPISPRLFPQSLEPAPGNALVVDGVGAHLKVLEQSVDTSSAAGQAFFGMLAVFAAFETDVRVGAIAWGQWPAVPILAHRTGGA